MRPTIKRMSELSGGRSFICVMRTMICAALIAALSISLIPVTVRAEEPDSEKMQTETFTYVNPIYSDIINADDLVKPSSEMILFDVSSDVVDTLEDAGNILRDGFVSREESIQFSIDLTTGDFAGMDSKTIFNVILSEALKETDDPSCGDYLRYQYGGTNFSFSSSGTIGQITYTTTYYTTAEQEAAVTAEVSEVIASMELDDKTEDYKAAKIYEYITSHVVYDYDNLNNSSYKLKYTSYAALINGTSVCQGYANLFYRLCREAGLSARIISGTGAGGDHAWNIVRIENLYYNVDSTWDAGRSPSQYEYFLKCDANFSDHERENRNDIDYTSAEFYAAYPMSSVDYEYYEPADQGTCGEDLTWILDDKGVLTISGTGAMEKFASSETVPWHEIKDRILCVVIEDEVTSIEQNAFYECFSLTDIQIGQSVQWIADNAFCRCRSLESVVMPDSVTSIGISIFSECDMLREIKLSENLVGLNSYTFWNCPSLESISIPSSVTWIGDQALSYCESLKNVEISGNLVTIGFGAFLNSISLENINIPETVVSIGEHAFEECSSLNSIEVIGSGKTVILDEAFAKCTSLENVFIGAGVYDIRTDDGTFSGCTSLKNIDVDPQNSYYCDEDGVLLSADRTELLCYPAGRDEEIYVVPEDVTEIDSGAFSHAALLKTLILPDGMKRIGYKSFEYCGMLESAELPDSLEYLGDYSFSHCQALKSIEIPDGISMNGFGVFEYCQSMTLVKLPDGLTAIGGSMFEGCTALEDVGIPESVTAINNDAFKYCQSLVQPALPEGLETIGTGAFSFTGIEAITFPEGLKTIGAEAFSNCHKLKEITIPDNVTELGEYSFSECDVLETAAIGRGITAIPRNLFWGDSALAEVVLSSGLKSVGESAFLSCSALSDVYYSGDAEAWAKISYGNNNEKLLEAVIHFADFVVDSGKCGEEVIWTLYEDGLLSIGGTGAMDDFDGDDVSAPWHEYADEICKLYIDNEVTSIGARAFADCSAIEQLTIPASIISIGIGAFADCTAITDVYFGGSETQWDGIDIGDNNEPLTEAEISYTGEIIDSGSCGENASWTLNEYGNLTVSGSGNISDFDDEEPAPWKEYASDIVSVTITKGIEGIGSGSFSDCSALTEVTIPESVMAIGENAFAGCEALAYVYYGAIELDWDEIMIGEGNEALAESEIQYTGEVLGSGNCGDNATWKLYDGGILIVSGEGCIWDYDMDSDKPWSGHRKDIKKVAVREGITAIGSYTFANIEELSDVGLPDSLTSIGEGAFLSLNIKTIELPEGLISIGDYAFEYCSLEEAILPDSLEKIGEAAFEGCEFAEIFIPASVTAIGKNAFGNSNLQSITVDPENAAYSDIDGVLFDKDAETLLFYPLTFDTSYTVPDGVKTIGESAFYGSSVKHVVFPDSLKEIGNEAFRGCLNIELIAIPEGAEIIGDMAFYDCWYLRVAEMPDTLLSIGEKAFMNTGLVNVVIPDSVVKIGSYAFSKTAIVSAVIPAGLSDIPEGIFSDCTSLNSIDISEGVITIGSNAFSGCFSLTEAQLPESITGIGSGAFSGCYLLESVNIPEGITEIQSSTFSRCSNLNGLILPEGITTIGAWAFYSCSSLSEIQFPDSIVTIDDGAFYGCSSLESVSLGENLKEICSEAFDECTNLKTVRIESVTNMNGSVFRNCSSLTDISFGAGVEDIEEGVFEGCKALVNIDVDEENNSYIVKDGVLFNFRQTKLICCPAGLEVVEYTIPDGVTELAMFSFCGCDKLQKLTIPKSLTFIGSTSFDGCISLTSVYYCGTEEEWNGVEIEDYMNDPLYNAEFWYVTPLTYVEEVAPSCTEDGYLDHWIDEKTGKLYSDALGENEIEADELVIPATGHKYGEPVWSWADDYSSATAVFTCKYEDDTQTVTASVSSVTNPATAENDGSIVYTAVVTFAGKEYTDEKTEVIPASGQTEPVDPPAPVTDRWHKAQIEAGGTVKDVWYYYRNGSFVIGWQKINGTWYLFSDSGEMLTGWQKVSGVWYYFTSGGAMVTGWQQIGGTWYYFKDSGAMVTGWQQVSGKWYYFKSSGAMAANEWCEGYWLNADGSWTYQPKGSWKQDSTGWWFGDTSGWYAKNTMVRIDNVYYTFNASGYWVK